jgi:hypothetical protein
MKKTIRFVLIILFVMSSGCEKRNIGTKSILENPCSPPCWQGIIPGVTTESEAEKILKKIAVTEKDPFLEPTSPYEIFEKSTCWRFLDYGGVCLEEIGGIVQGIDITPIEKFNLDQLLALYGPPSHVLLFKGFGDYSFVGKLLFYKSMGIYISLDIVPYDHSMKPTIEQNDMVVRISFYNPILFIDYVNYVVNFHFYEDEQEIDVFGQPWHGFGEYEYSR